MRRKHGILSKNFGRPVRLKLTWAKPAGWANDRLERKGIEAIETNAFGGASGIVDREYTVGIDL